MTDQRHDIPMAAFISAQIVQQAAHTGDFALCVRSVERQHQLSPGDLGEGLLISHVPSLLYCLIVVPKEIWILSENDAVYANIDKDWLLALFTVELSEESFAKHPVYYLIHHLRNAVAHVNFSIAEDLRFTFWDQRNKTSAPYFRASASIDSLQQFLSKIGAILANLRGTRC